MNPEIKNRFTGEVIVPAGKYQTIREACEKEYKSLSRADLSEANLSRANLSWANLSRAKIYGEIITKPLGCEVHKATEWWEFSDKEISEMHEEALEFWKKNKSFIKAAWKHHSKK